MTDHLHDLKSLEALNLGGMGRGIVARSTPRGSLACASAAPIDLIPREQWPDLIAEMEREESRISDLAKYAGFKAYNQSYHSLCHSASLTGGLVLSRIAAGQPYVRLAPASLAGPTTGYQDVGWEIGGALHTATVRGCCSTEFLGEFELNRSKNESPEATANAALHRAYEAFDLDPYNFDQIGTCLLRRKPVIVCLMRFPGGAHSVLFTDLLCVKGRFGVRFLNSWDVTYGDDGYGTLDEQSARPDEAYIVGHTGVSDQ